MDFGTFVIAVLLGIIVTIINFFFFRAIIISAMKQVFIDLQNANAAIRVVTVEDAEPLSHEAADNMPTRSQPPLRTANTLVTSGGKVFRRKEQKS